MINARFHGCMFSHKFGDNERNLKKLIRTYLKIM